MKATELKKRLEKIIKEQGDCNIEICINDIENDYKLNAIGIGNKTVMLFIDKIKIA